MAKHEPTWKSALAGAGVVVAFVFGLMTWGNSIVGRAEAAGVRTEDRLENRLNAIEAKLDKITDILIHRAKEQ